MAIYKKTIQCPKCRHEVGEVWLVVNGGLCGNCLVKNMLLEDALANICPCLHVKVTKLYKQYARHTNE